MTTLPEPLAFPFARGESRYHPSPVFAQLREERPVTRITTPDGRSAWMVTRWADVRRVLTDPRFSRAAATRGNVPLNGLGRLSNESLLALDPPQHTRQRKLIGRALTPRRVEQLRPRVTRLVDELLGNLARAPQPADLVSGFTVPLPVLVICELLGVPVADRHRLHAWSDEIMGDWGARAEELERALADFMGYFAELCAVKRRSPGDDLITELVAARDDGAGTLSDSELMNLCVGLFIAGHETTVGELTMSVLTLLHHGEWDRLCAEPELIPGAVDELLRYVQISAAGGTLPRVTTEPVELGGVQLPAGAVVLTATPSANRDGARFAEADRLDLTRTDVAHLTFGAGAHHCLGAVLARMELQEALHGLIRHLPGLRLAVPEADLSFTRGMMIRSLDRLPVTFSTEETR
ncbi:cytochrome P450 [Actinoplanes sp. N902-109]|uniref:cytochrome P450 n=1 Tax=Actinoplanes sp. (strain N902-109) TaxID=649831 RepID=UPI0003295D43|nr:cytochrome P450 [Actinoplanes sp. N902-109]AGL16728.1 cytochrome P450 hydroxylase [Actinoplanes sp. N902-109]